MKTILLILAISIQIQAQTAYTALGQVLLSIDNDKVSKYINKCYPHAVYVHEHFGIPISISIGQSCLETGFGTSYSYKVRKNCFGVRRNHEYMIYKTIRESWEDFGSVLCKMCYKRLAPTTIEEWLKALKACKYAKSKDYKWKVNSIIFKYGIDLLDE